MSAVTLVPVQITGSTRGQQDSRVKRDRLELLTALIGGPRFDPLLRPDLMALPRDHAVFGWACRVPSCLRARADNRDLCNNHAEELSEVTKAGGSRAEFLRAARPLEASDYIEEPVCQICLSRPAGNIRLQLCHRHSQAWLAAGRENPAIGFTAWLTAQEPLPGFGGCVVAICDAFAVSSRGLCSGHYNRYRHPESGRRGRGGKRSSTPVDDSVFEAWCRTADPIWRPGRLTLTGVAPLVAAEIKWGMFVHGQQPHHSVWPLRWLQGLVNRCRAQNVSSLMAVEPKDCPPYDRMIVTEIRNQLRLVYYSPADTKEAGFIEFDHFGGRLRSRRSFYDLSVVSQRWLRDLLWDNLADQLRAPNPPRSDTPYDAGRRACAELSAYLEVEAPAGGHDPVLLNAEHMQAFVADQRHRARNGLQSLGCCGRDGKPTVFSELTRTINANHIRRVLRQAMDSGETDRIGLAREFVVAAPTGGVQSNRTRRPFPDDVARALADEANLALLADKHDPNNGGIRLIWEAIIYTGRRCGEVIGLKLECAERYSGLPVLWHDQTKVGNYDEAIRIPEVLYTKILERQQLTIERFTYRHGRPPTELERSRMALFPSLVRNPDCTRPSTYTWFHTHFRAWVDELDLGRWVAHQARHTLATKLLANGAALHHIRRYLGHVSPKMTEHYAKIAVSALDEVLDRVWVAGPGAPEPGRLLSGDLTGLTREQADALAIDLSRRSTPTEGGFCTFQPVVSGGACPFNLNCEGCDKFVMSGADLLYWRRKREQWTALAERAPDDATAEYLHQVFEPTARAIDGLEKALAGLGLLDDALALDLRRPQDYFHRVWSTAFRATHLTAVHTEHPDTGEARP
ncbi:site-specific integrase [Actinoplanes sp. TFC3]|uniref:tyrosine-type recombinase/integrase n=1 Tax=Actinoplanes sp. TFC3 TaxID=1710355 RepID=UPI00082CD2C6|nr:site-specific integrase [Actinoplanes sp. TFC3]